MDTTTELFLDFVFWTGYYDNEDCVKWASARAYLDMNRTMTFREKLHKGNQNEHPAIQANRANWRNAGTEIIKENILKGATDFNEWHRTTCLELIAHYGNDKLVSRQDNSSTNLTYGQAQKWINMTLKYLWLLNRLALIEDVNICNFIECHAQTFHVPLDSYILRYVAKQNKSKANPFPVQGNGLNDSFDEFWNLWKSTWSQIKKSDEYYAYQKKLANATGELSPLQWELIHWHKALIYYGKIENQ